MSTPAATPTAVAHPAIWLGVGGVGAALVLMGLPPLALPLLLVAAAAGVFLLADTRTGIVALAFAIAPLGIVEAEIASVTINLPEALILLLFAKEAARFVLRGERPVPEAPWGGMALYAVAAVVAIGTGLSHGNGARAVFQDARQFTEYLVLFLLVVHRVHGLDEVRRVLIAFLIGCASLAAHGALQRYSPIGIPGKQFVSDLVYHGAVRSGSFYGATPLGGIMVLAIGPALGLLWSAKRPAVRAALLVVLALLLIAAIYTKTRASWIAIAFLIGVFFLGIRKTPAILAAALAGALLFAAVLGPEVAQRMSTLSFSKAERSLRMRVQYYTTAAHIARAAPFFGLGWGCYYYQGDILVNGYYTPREPNERPIGAKPEATVHSAYLQLLVKSGLFGVAAFAMLLLQCAVEVLRRCGRGCRGAPAYPLFLGCVAAICGYLFHAGLENFFQWPVMAQSFWLLAGCALILSRELEVAASEGEARHE